MPLPGLPLSVLDLAPVGAGASAADAVQATLALARRADQLGFTRFWVAEHHNMPGMPWCSATQNRVKPSSSARRASARVP